MCLCSLRKNLNEIPVLQAGRPDNHDLFSCLHAIDCHIAFMIVTELNLAHMRRPLATLICTTKTA